MRLPPRGWRHHLLPGLVIVLLLGACGGAPDRSREQRDPAVVRVASFDFAESELLAEVFAQAIETTGAPVERRVGLGSREVVQPTLEQGLVDVVPEYLASSLEFAEMGSVATLRAKPAAARLESLMRERAISVLPYARAVDRNAIAMRAQTANQLDVTTISDLAPVASSLDFIGPPECPERPACLPVLEQKYGIRFRSFNAVPVGGIPLQLEAGDADVGVAFTSDPSIKEHDLVLLRPDREEPRADNVVPLVRTPVLERYPGITAALARVTSRLTTSELRALNGRVAAGEPVDAVARAWLA
jgi:osmoprotectant transport system substrate-binding protein